MRQLIVLMIVVLFSGCGTVQSAVKKGTSFEKYQKIYVAPADKDPRNVLPKIREQLEGMGFTVVMPKKDEPVGGIQGTGFIISTDGYVLTSAHTLGTQTEATLWLNGTRYEADLIYKEGGQENDEKTKQMLESSNMQEVLDASLNSPDNSSIAETLARKDMALLKIKGHSKPFAPVTLAVNPTYTMGQEVYSMGFPLSNILGDNPRLNKGLVSSAVGIKDSPDYFQVSAEIQPGNSGGPVLNAEGQVIGLMQMTLNPVNVMTQTGGAIPQNVNFAAKIPLMREFLKNAQSKASVTLHEGETMTFEAVQNAIVQVRSGIIPASFKDEPKLVCAMHYLYLWDVWYRFATFEVTFYDWDTKEVLVRAGQYSDDMLSTEQKTINRVFENIRQKIGR